MDLAGRVAKHLKQAIQEWETASDRLVDQFAQALQDQDLLDADGLPPSVQDDGRPVLIAWSDNGSEMTATDTRTFMAMMAITQHHGRPGTPTDQAQSR